MKSAIACLFAVGAMIMSVHAADVTTKLTDVHLCCASCVNIAQKAVTDGAPGVKAVADRESDTITLTGPDTAAVQKAADALVKVGYFGKSSNADIKISTDAGAKGQQVASLDVNNVHLCCAKCAKAATDAVMAVPGVKGTTGIAKDAKTFQVTGSFKDSDVFAALQKVGLTGTEGATK
jgi:hypothetical protein